MKEKLLALLKSEGLKPSQLADMLGINPAGVSHILAGRNKPGFDLLQKILRRFPQINPDWLLLDAETMYRTDYNPIASRNDESIAGSDPSEFPFSGELFNQATIGQERATHPPITSNDQVPIVGAALAGTANKRTAAIERVVIFYADHTFESYLPSDRYQG